MYNNIKAVLWLNGNRTELTALESDQEVTDIEYYMIRLAIAEHGEYLITEGAKDLQDGVLIEGCYCEDNYKRWFDLYSIECIGAEYAALIGG